jgi:hypothetical protein
MDEMEKHVENKMDDMEKHMEKEMLDLQNSMSSMILHALDESLPKGEIKLQGNHENAEEINIESYNHDYSSLQDPHHQSFNAAPRNYFIPNIDMRKFDGKYLITWIL